MQNTEIVYKWFSYEQTATSCTFSSYKILLFIPTLFTFLTLREYFLKIKKKNPRLIIYHNLIKNFITHYVQHSKGVWNHSINWGANPCCIKNNFLNFRSSQNDKTDTGEWNVSATTCSKTKYNTPIIPTKKEISICWCDQNTKMQFPLVYTCTTTLGHSGYWYIFVFGVWGNNQNPCSALNACILYLG